MDDLTSASKADGGEANKLLPLVYDELKRLAARRLAAEAPGQTLQPTALVHEAYMRLVGKGGGGQWDGERHFFAAAAEAMRRILVEHARYKRRQKHGGGHGRAEIEIADLPVPELREDVLALDEALTKLAETNKTAAAIVELRYFAGLTLAQAATMLGISPRSADRLWAYARAWLHDAIEGEPDDPKMQN